MSPVWRRGARPEVATVTLRMGAMVREMENFGSPGDLAREASSLQDLAEDILKHLSRNFCLLQVPRHHRVTPDAKRFRIFFPHYR